jgi:hypothetical protein
MLDWKLLSWRSFLCAGTLLLAANNALHLIASAIDPLQLDYSEGLVVGGLERITHHPGLATAYSFNPAFYNTTDLAYPPVFPYLAAGLARLLGLFTNFNDPTGTMTSLYAARALTLFGLSLSVWLIYRLIRLRHADRLVAAASASLLLCFHPTIYWGVYARVDALGLAFVLAGLYVIVKSQKSKTSHQLPATSFQPPTVDTDPSPLSTQHSALSTPLSSFILAILLFWLALFTKQSLVAAPLAVALYLFFAGRRREALLFVGALAGLAGISIAALAFATNGNYLFFLTMERFTPFSIAKMFKTWGLFLALYWPLCAAAVWQARQSFRTGGSARLLVIWGELAFLVSLTVGKAGAADYYFFEIMAFISLMVGWLATPGQKRPLRAGLFRSLALLQLVALAGVGIWLDYPANDRDAVREADGQAASYVRQYAAPDKKIFAEMSGPAIAAGRPDQVFDHFIFRQLAAAGQRDGQALVQDFATKRFKLALFGYDVLKYDLRPDVTEPSPWPPGFEKAVRDNYRLLQDIRGSDGRPYAWALVPKDEG